MERLPLGNWRGWCPLPLWEGCLAQGKLQPEMGPDILVTWTNLPAIPSCQNCPGLAPLHDSTSLMGSNSHPQVDLGNYSF